MPDQPGLSASLFREVAAQAAQSRTAAAESDSLATSPPTLDETDRSLIGRMVITLYVWVVPVTLLVILANGAVEHTWAATSAEAVDLIKVGVIPIVTLVLGYYFGKSAKP